MPIYEYEPIHIDTACPTCAGRFEVIQRVDEAPLEACPSCGMKVRKVMSWCRAAVMETSDEHVRVSRAVSEYEKAGMWSHAAEMADIHAEKTKDNEMRMRALDNYRKAGYDLGTLEKHAKTTSE